MRELHRTKLESEAYGLEGMLILEGIHARTFLLDPHAKEKVYLVAVQRDSVRQARVVRRSYVKRNQQAEYDDGSSLRFMPSSPSLQSGETLGSETFQKLIVRFTRRLCRIKSD